MSPINLTIDDIGAGGDGIAHIEGAAVFVAGTITGEKVRVEMQANKRGYLIEILEKSPNRAPPSCPHFPTCGGCKLQHLNNQLYADFKLKNLMDILRREGLPLPPFDPIVITPPQTRRRARLAAKNTKNGVVIGFNEEHSHNIVNIEDCAVLAPALMTLIPKIREHIGLWLPKGEEGDIHLTALDSGIDMVLIGGAKLDLDVREKLGTFAQMIGVARLSWKKWDRSPPEPIAAQAPLTVTFGKTTLPFPPASFLQATQAGEKALIDFVKAHVKDNARVLDLFCGLGTFGLSLEKPKYVHFSDLDGSAVETLEKTLKGNARAEVERRNLISEPFSAKECDAFDVIIFDPPRGGAKNQAQEIAKSKVKTVIAISCDPPTFARDAMILIKGGYTLRTLLPVDQFLWSKHTELAAKFERI